MESIEQKTIEGRSIEDNLSRAKELFCVENNYFSPEQAAYCLAWNDIVNPESKANETILYNAIGPDLLTPLLVWNADKINGVERIKIDVKKINHYLQNWDIVDKNTEKLPIISTKSLKKFGSPLSAMIENRRKRGYWDIDDINTWSLERCLIIEMKKMSIARDSIKISEKNGQICLDFEWSFPGEEIRQRHVNYINETTYDIFANPEKYGISEIDGFYEKSMMSYRSEKDPNRDLPAISSFIKPGGFALMGRTQFSLFGNKEWDKKIEQFNKSQFGPNYKTVDIASEYKIMMQKFFGPKKEYNWELYGLAKNEN